RHLADLVPSALDAGERRARGGAIRGGEQRFGLLEQGELLLEVLAELSVLDGVGLGLRAIEHVARGLETRPQRVIRLLACAARSLPLVEQSTVVGDARSALARESLGLLDEGLLAGARVAVHAVELGEERLAGGLDR